MHPRVYIETSIVSYLTAKSTSNVIAAARQEITRVWWSTNRNKYDLVTSQTVVDECQAGDAEAVARRLQVLQGLPSIPISDQAISAAAILMRQVPLPAKANVDALHVALA